MIASGAAADARRCVIWSLIYKHLLYGGPRPAPSYAKYEEADIASTGVSGRARPPHSADDSVNLPRASVPPGVSIRPVLLRLPPRLASGGLHIKNMGGERRSGQAICNGYKCADPKLSAVPRELFFLSCVRTQVCTYEENEALVSRVLKANLPMRSHTSSLSMTRDLLSSYRYSLEKAAPTLPGGSLGVGASLRQKRGPVFGVGRTHYQQQQGELIMRDKIN